MQRKKPKCPVKKRVCGSSGAEAVCRACAGSAYIPLREQLGRTDLMSALRALTNLPVSVEDDLPQHICLACYRQLVSCYKFQQRCCVTQRKLLAKKKLVEPQISYLHPMRNFEDILHKMRTDRVLLKEKRETFMKSKLQTKREEKKKKIKVKTGPITKFKCSPCDVTFNSKEALVGHRRLGGCLRRACHICGQLVLSLRQHLRSVHAPARPHVCSVCGKHFPIVARLRSHQRVHEDSFNFHCAHCPYKCKHKHYLVVHMRTHTGEKPYTCRDCGAKFINPSNLNKHRLVHAEKSFACESCEKCFRSRAALREHDEAAHRNVKHACRACGRHFCYRSDLRKHEIRHHNREKRAHLGIEPKYRQVERLHQHDEQLPDQTWQQQPQDSAAIDKCSYVAPAVWPDTPLSLATLLAPHRPGYHYNDTYTHTHDHHT